MGETYRKKSCTKNYQQNIERTNGGNWTICIKIMRCTRTTACSAGGRGAPDLNSDAGCL